MTEPKTFTGATLTEPTTRRCSQPVPGELVAALATARLTADDQDQHLWLLRDGAEVGAVWRPAVEGDWFGCTGDPVTVFRVSDRDEALRRVIAELAGDTR